MKKTLAYVDHNYHIKTKSGDFLREIFKSKFKIKNYWIGKELIFERELFNYKNIFFFQILPSTKQLKNLNIKTLCGHLCMIVHIFLTGFQIIFGE